MGSSVNTIRMPSKLKRLFIEVFSRLPYSFIWKWDADERVLKNLPKNIKTGKWFPQQDLLGNHNHLARYQRLYSLYCCNRSSKIKSLCHTWWTPEYV